MDMGQPRLPLAPFPEHKLLPLQNDLADISFLAWATRK